MTRFGRLIGGWGLAAALAAAVPWGLQAFGSDAPQQAPGPRIPSLNEPGEGLEIRNTSDHTGFVTFAATEHQGILVSVQANAPTETRARSFLGLYGQSFGITDQAQLRLARTPEMDALGVEHVRFKQQHQGIPVAAGDLVVHLKGSRVQAVNGHVVRDLPDDVTPDLPAGDAIVEARHLVAKVYPGHEPTQMGAPRLEFLDRSLFEPNSSYAPRLAWFIEAHGDAIREFIWVDADTGAILLNFNQATDAKNRSIYNANNTGSLPGTLMRVEGGPATGNVDADNAYNYSGLTYDYYFTTHGRDSYNGTGGALISSINFDDGNTCPNAFWNGSQMVYCAGFANADDVVAHELTHAVTENSAGLFYYYQSGALNESYSDVFGETVDLLNGGDEGQRWYLGEDLSIGAIRNMMDPGIFGDPARVGDAAFWCSAADSGGVHINSGVPNHAYALMVDGGTYNGYTITGIGTSKADKIEYRALTVYLTSGSTFLDNFNSLNQACTDLIGTNGITVKDCTQVRSAIDAVQMDERWNCSGATAPAPLCSTGAQPSGTTFLDTFESGVGNWTLSNPSGAQQWQWFTGFAKNGDFMIGTLIRARSGT